MRSRGSIVRWLAVLGLAAMIPFSAIPASADAAATWTAGPDAAGDNTYDGYVDLPTAGGTVAAGSSLLVGGWVVDKAAQGWAGIDDVQVFLGSMGSGGTMLAKGIVAQNRSDVGAALGNGYWAASGFSAVVPAQALKAGATSLKVYVHTPGKGWWYKPVSLTVGPGQAAATASAAASSGSSAPGPRSDPLPGGKGARSGPLVNVVESPKWGDAVHTDRLCTIMGYALDQTADLHQGSQGSGIDRVQIYINGERGTGAYLGDASVPFSDANAATFGSQFANSGYRLTFNPTKYPTGSANLYVYARSAVTGKEVVALISIGITDAPTPTS